MPIVRISFDRQLSLALSGHADALLHELSDILEVGLASDRAKPQVILQPDAYIAGPFLIYVDLQFRANAFRDQARVSAVLKDMAASLEKHFHCPVRLRGFSIDQATLSALDHQPGGEVK